MRNPVSERVRMAGLGWLATLATSLSFFPALQDKGYLFLAAFFNGLVVLTGIGLRALRVPAFAVLAGQVVVLFELLLLKFGEGLRFGFLPGSTTFSGIEAILRSGADVAQTYPAPAPKSTGLLLMVVFAITLVGLLVDAIAVSLGRVPLAGLPLLAMYTIPVAVLPDGVPFLAFVAGGAAYVAMLMADERDRLTHWGRLVSRQINPSDPTRIDTSGLNSAGRRVSVIALAAAVVLPVFLPTLPSSILDGGGGEGEGGNGSTLSFKDPMVSLAKNLRQKKPSDLLRVSGDVQPEYLRLVVLDTPKPDAWKARALTINEDATTPLTTLLPRPVGLSPEIKTEAHTSRIELTEDFPRDSRWLPVPYNVSTVNAGTDYSYVLRDQTVVLSTRDENAIDDTGSYRATYADVEPTPEQLRATDGVPAQLPALYTDVPGDVPSVVAETAAGLTQGAATDYDKALILQSFFRAKGEFTYDLDAAYGYGYSAMARFLEQRHGFCQHFAATMAMMARTLGIPARVAVGFLKPDHIDGDQWVITSDNVHAWPELYFEGVGWLEFEPTPGVGAGFPEYAQKTTAPTEPSTLPTTTGPSAPADTRPERTAESDAADAGGSSSSGGGSGPLPPIGWLVLVVLIVLVLTPAALRAGVRRSRLNRPLEPASAAEAAWLELRDRIRDLRLPWTGSMTPRARERAIAPLLYGDDEALAALRRLTLSVERARYAASLAEDANPSGDAEEVMAAIGREADRRQRMLAFFLPTSLLPDIRVGWEAFKARLRGRRRAMT